MNKSKSKKASITVEDASRGGLNSWSSFTKGKTPAEISKSMKAKSLLAQEKRKKV